MKVEYKKYLTTTNICVAALVIIIVLLIRTVFNSKKDSSSYKSELAVKDSLIADRNRTIDVLNNSKKHNDSALNELSKEIQGLRTLYYLNRNRETKIIHEYEKIPGDVHAFDRDKLRREFTDSN